ncbi:MAG: hypothetical protein IPP78_12030 [Holophagaceae bacterium]|nr:hypothetical protein [Holophagaceae bacterium]
MRHRGILSLAGALLAVAFMELGCVDVAGGGTTGGTVLYAYDNNAHQLIEWDASAFYDSDNPTTLKTVTSSVFTNKMDNLAWGGLCLDSSNNQLYLVHESTGVVVRVSNIRGQNGTITSNSPDVVTFTLGNNSDRLSSGKFGQAAIDSATRTLYVTEKNDSGDTRIWVVSNAASQAQDSIVTTNSTITVAGDTACTGVAAGLGGQVFAYFNSGDAIGIDAISGPRLRKGGSSGFSKETSVLVGAKTSLGKYGTLALDSGNNLVFTARHNVDASASAIPVQAFEIGQFNGGGYNQGPTFTLGTVADQGSIRVLAHPGNKEWLAALNSSGEQPANVIHIWKLPRDTGSVAKIKNITAALFKGITFDGNN